MTGRGRYAPSPTGPLHLGNVRTALLAWLHARQTGSAFVLRMEDIDGPRCNPVFAAQILEDLRWLGLDWDEGPDVGGSHAPYTQTERVGIYEDALARLVASGHAYPCWCSRKEIAEASSAPHGTTPVYPGTCRDLTAEERLRRQAERPDRLPSWRFRIEGETTVRLVDGILGAIEQDVAVDVGDFVLKRADGLWAYQLAVVVDDVLMGITDVVRGADLADSAPRQVLLWQTLAPLFGMDVLPPTFWHVPLMVDASGQRMSKRDGSDSLVSLRDRNSPEQVLGMLAASLGWGAADGVATLVELVAKPSWFRR